MHEPARKPARLVSVDAYRGFVMFLLLAEALHLPNVAKAFPDNAVWQEIRYHTSHVEWAGCSLHDLIQPSFSFLVGVALPFSLASRLAKGHGFGRMFGHAVWRAFLLIALGILLRSQRTTVTNFTFEDTLTQIGLGYAFLFLLGFMRNITWLWVAVGVILAGYFAAFAMYPLPPSDFDYAAVGVKPGWPHLYDGFLAHWNKNSNAAWAFDTWFLNLFGRPIDPKTGEVIPFLYNGGGYATLSFIPTLGTMILGLIAGRWLREGYGHGGLLLRLVLAGLVCLGLGYGLDVAGINPIVKRIWTPAWTLYSGGICFLITAGFWLVFDGGSPLRILAFPLVVIGANSILIYCLESTASGWLEHQIQTHAVLLQRVEWWKQMTAVRAEYEPIVRGAVMILVFWLLLLWLYLKRIFVKI